MSTMVRSNVALALLYTTVVGMMLFARRSKGVTFGHENKDIYRLLDIVLAAINSSWLSYDSPPTCSLFEGLFRRVKSPS